MVENASVVPGMDGRTEESTTKIFDHPKGRPRRSLSSGPAGRTFIGKAEPQWVPDPGFENLIIQWQNTVPNRSPLENRSFAARRAAALASSEILRSSSSTSSAPP